ncbi:MAG: ABC transporter substrate-binding protein [Ardenticatenales bacterium]
MMDDPSLTSLLTRGAARAAGRCLALAGAAALAACTARPTPFGPPAPPPAPTVDPRALVWALDAAPTTLDAARSGTDTAAIEVAAQVNDGLFRYRDDGGFEIAPGLAENWDGDVSGKIYTFTLRHGLVFADGTPLDAPAVKWNFERWLKPDHPAHKGRFLQWLSLFGAEDEKGIVEKVEALDALTLRISLRQPFAPFVQHLANPAFGIASPRAVTAQGEDYGVDGDHLPVGSGPYRVVAWDKDSSVVRLEANPLYWGTPPKTPNIVFAAIPDADRRAEAVAAGTVAGAGFSPAMPVTGTLATPGVRLLPRPARASTWLMLDTSASPLSDRRVREAISLAIDRQALASAHFGSQAQPSGQLLPPGFLGYDANLAPPMQDVERAKALLAEADVEDGFKLRIWVPDQPRPYLPDPAGAAQTIADMLKVVGIDASVNPISTRRFLDNRDRGTYRAWLIGWEAQSSDPDSTWYWHFNPTRTAAEGHYNNPDLFKLLLEAQRTAVTDRRRTLYESAAALLAADQPRIFLVNTRPLVAIGPRVQGYSPGAMGFDTLAGVTLAGAGADATAPPALDRFLAPTATATPDGGPAAPTAAGATEADATAADTPTPTVTPPPTDTPTPAPTATAVQPARSRSAP